MALTNLKIRDTYKDLLTVLDSSNPNQGLESTVKTVYDGEGVASAIELSTTILKIPSDKTLVIEGTLNCVDATLTGDLNVGDDLTVTDLVTATDMNITGEVKVGGGFDSTGITLETDGDVNMDGNLYVGGNMKVIGEVKVDSKVKRREGTDGRMSMDVGTLNQINLSIEKSSADKSLLNLLSTGVLTIKDELEDTKLALNALGGLTLKSGFEAKSNGTVKFKSHTTSELGAITGTAGELAYNSQTGKFNVWEP